MSFDTIINKKQYDGNDSTIIFSFPYLFQANGDLTVIHTDSDDNDTTFVIDVDYSVSGAGNPAGGSITTVVAPATGEKITIIREMDITQETDLSNHGAFFLESVEKAMDKLVMITQQLNEAFDRCVKLDITDTDTPPSVTDYNTALATVEALEAAFDNLVVQNHSAVATGAQTVFTMPAPWPDLDSTSNVTVYDDGLKIDRDDYSVTDTDEITFDTGRTVGHTIIFELHEALSSDDLDSAVTFRTQYNVIIGPGGDYTSMAAYIADAPAEGDRVLIKVDEVLTSTLVIPVNIQVTQLKGKKFTLSTNFSPIISFSAKAKTNGDFLVENSDTGTIAKAFELNGGDIHHDNLIIDNKSTGIITTAVTIQPNKKKIFATVRSTNSAGGAITNDLNDASTNDTNYVTVRGDAAISRSRGAKKFNTPVLTTPTIASQINANHTHNNPAGGGRIQGQIIQIVETVDGELDSGTNTMDLDDDIPQNTDGDEYMTVAITPTNASNILLIEAMFYGANSSAGHQLIVALFQNSIANALKAGWGGRDGTVNSLDAVYLSHKMVAGGVAEIIFKIRAGSELAGQTDFNGNSGARLLGGVCASYIRVTEIQV